MVTRFFLLVLCVQVLTATAQPTMYKLNGNDKLETDLVPVSSTVIPLPIYKVAYGFEARPGSPHQQHKTTVLDTAGHGGPVTLITAHGAKKARDSPKDKS